MTSARLSERDGLIASTADAHLSVSSEDACRTSHVICDPPRMNGHGPLAWCSSHRRTNRTRRFPDEASCRNATEDLGLVKQLDASADLSVSRMRRGLAIRDTAYSAARQRSDWAIQCHGERFCAAAVESLSDVVYQH